MHPIILISEYGDLLHLSPYARARTHKTGKVDLREVRLIDDNMQAKTLLKMLNQHPSTHFMFDPSKCHYGNARAIFLALKKLVDKRYYGHLDRKQVEKLTEKYGESEDEEEEQEGGGGAGSGGEEEGDQEGQLDRKQKKKLEAKQRVEERKQRARMKGTVFANCELPIDLMNE